MPEIRIPLEQSGYTRHKERWRNKIRSRLPNIKLHDQERLPNPRDIIDKLSGDQVFSKLDCCCAYWAVALEEKDIPKTAFSTPRGHFEMERMAFGLCNSQATYQRLIDRTMRNIGSTESYIDDILIHSSRIDQHINCLRQVFKGLRDAGIQLRADKCHLGFQEVEFLGHIITPDGHRPLSETVSRISNNQPPRDKKVVQKFLGLVNFYREYIQIYLTFQNLSTASHARIPTGIGTSQFLKLSPFTNDT